MECNYIVTCNVRAHTQAEESDALCVEFGRPKTNKHEIGLKNRKPLPSGRADL